MDSTTTAERPAAKQAAFSFVQDLASTLSRPDPVELPSFPDIAMRVKKVLEDETSTPDKIARVVGSEPGLAARLVKLANSAAINRSGQQILDLKTAIARLGQDQIRLSATSFAMKSLMETRTVIELKPFLTEWWSHSVRVAAVAYALGQRARGVDADQAMFVGLIHGIGKLYILTRVERFPELFGCPEAMTGIINDWHTAIGKAILENWGFPEHVLEAIDVEEHQERRAFGAPELVDVIVVADLFCQVASGRREKTEDFSDFASCKRMDIDARAYQEVMIESQKEIDELTGALNG